MNLLFFTNSFPFGKGETFIENEIEFLAEKFDKVYIFPMNGSGEKRSCPVNVETINISNGSNKITAIPKNYKVVVTEYTSLLNKVLLKKITFRQFKYFISLLNGYLMKAENLKTWVITNTAKETVYYSYWLDGWATILAILSSKGIIRGFHSRAHGYDIYEERVEEGFIPFRKFQLKEVKTVSSVSEAGANYLRSKFPKYREKFMVYRLGVRDNFNVFPRNGEFTIVSCSNLVPGKRVHLIVEIIKYLSFPVHWIHFGDGVLLNEIKDLAAQLPPNVTVDFKGRIPNTAIIEYYKHNQVDLFITTTESEGIPVSIMEAISFGIPIIGTAVGGVPEIVNESTGYLIEVEFEPEKIARIISQVATSENNAAFRNKTRRFWEQNYNASINFGNYIKEVLKPKTSFGNK